MIEFLEAEHIYLKDGIIVPSVSEILHFIFPNKYSNVPKEILNKKAEYGTKVHESIEIFEKTGEIIELNTLQELSFEQYLKLKDKWNVEVIDQEQMVSYEMYYCGRFDMIANVKKEYCLCDIKTTAELDKEYLSWQLSFYELAYGKQFDKLYAIWLPKRDIGQIVEIERKPKEKLLEILKNFEERRNAEIEPEDIYGLPGWDY